MSPLFLAGHLVNNNPIIKSDYLDIKRTMTNSTDDHTEDNIHDTQPKHNKTASNQQPTVSTGLNVGILLATIIFPIVGIAMGFSYLRKGHASTIKAGKTWLIAGVIMLIIQAILIYFSKPN